MIPTKRTLLIAGAAAAVSGCAVLRAPDPVQLYRFGQSAGPGDAASAASTATILYLGTSFPRAAAVDRILTSNGVEVSYIAGSRWSAPALIAFEEAVLRAFQGSSVRLVRRGATARADATLRIEVRTFEARYTAPDAPPMVVIETRALLTPTAADARTLDADFSVQQPVPENRVSAIAAAFDAATADILSRTVSWVAANTRPASSG